MNQHKPELSKLQRQVLQVFKKLESKQNVTGVARHLKIEPVLAKSLLDQLTELHLLRLKFEGTVQYYAMQQAGVDYLRKLANSMETTAEPATLPGLSMQQNNAFNLVQGAGSYGLSAKAVAEKLNIPRVEAATMLQHLVHTGHINKWANGVYHIPALVKPAAVPAQSQQAASPRVKGALEKAFDAAQDQLPTDGQLQDERLKQLKVALGQLEQKIKFPPQIRLVDYELKQQVLQRLSEFFEESISSVLTDIRADLQHIHNFNSGVQQ